MGACSLNKGYPLKAWCEARVMMRYYENTLYRFWKQRNDRYSELRAQQMTTRKKDMNVIGG